MTSELLAGITNAVVSVRAFQGINGNGGDPILAAAISVPVWLTRKQQMVRNGDGETVVSQSSISADPAFIDALAPQSEVTIPGEAPTTVISRQVSAGGSFVTGLDRVKAFLQ